MGNCLRSHFCDPSTRSSVANNGPSTSGTSKINYSNTTIDFSATSGSAASKSQFSEAVSHDEGNEATNNPIGQILESPNLKEFTFADLKSTTKNFKSDTLLGGGGFGKVYKGWIDERTYAPSKSGSGMVVAIKKLNPESMQGFQEWQVFSFSNFVVLIFMKGIIEHLVITQLSIFALFLYFSVFEFAANPLMEGQASIFNSKFQLCIFNSKDQLCWYSRKV
ncbi:hypothetical protein OIU79_000587 [Salix purpurea]|uniref:Protein kinase domain-containing protein n=1 Tax=Salix purpurea TaxID=77065 RepID=A0A9Q0V2E7_SALPP|nr:hypothetical protein OIU79_000587 [Salix purpurea]